ncbi:uncharacterized protein LOC141909621 [Tubulanus polymorphus]|uniref:uncharacterized protein LOC141909621 n=1 Tax=Tubulanus polymorphus TaxID=672921 RepID=UPI003DA28CE6
MAETKPPSTVVNPTTANLPITGVKVLKTSLTVKQFEEMIKKGTLKITPVPAQQQQATAAIENSIQRAVARISGNAPTQEPSSSIPMLSSKTPDCSVVSKSSSKRGGGKTTSSKNKIVVSKKRKFHQLADEIKQNIDSDFAPQDDDEGATGGGAGKSKYKWPSIEMSASKQLAAAPEQQEVKYVIEREEETEEVIDDKTMTVKTHSDPEELQELLKSSGGISFDNDHLVIGEQRIEIEPGTDHLCIEVVPLKNGEKVLTVECRKAPSPSATVVNKPAPSSGVLKSYQSELIVPPELRALLRRLPLVRMRTTSRRSTLGLTLHMKNNYETLVRWFPCSRAGRDDKNAMAKINAYLGSDDCLQAVKAKNDLPGLDIDVDKCMTVDSLLLRKPAVRAKSDHLSVEFMLHNKRVVHKKFASANGSDDPVAMDDINQFIASDEAVQWLRDCYKIPATKDNVAKTKSKSATTTETESKIDRFNKRWRYIGELEVGAPTKWYFDGFRFDFKKRYNFEKGIVAISPDNLQAGISTYYNKNWGRSHRFDDVYALQDDAGDTTTRKGRAVTLQITCAGKSDQCRAKCLNLIKDIDRSLDVQNCSGCGLDLQRGDVACTNCRATNTRHWYKLFGHKVCNSCHNYYCKYKRQRPAYMEKTKKMKVNFYHEHFECAWSMFLIIDFSDMKKWKMYEGVNNANYHQEEAVQPTKRLSQSFKDDLDRLVVSQAASSKQIYKKYAHLMKRNNYTGIAMTKQQLRTRIRSCRDRSKNRKRIIESAAAHVITTPAVAVHPETATTPSEVAAVEDVATEIHVPDTTPAEIRLYAVSNQEEPLLCTLCINENLEMPFSCNSQTAMVRHISTHHATQLFSCCVCYQLTGRLVSFDTEGLVRKHCREQHSQYLVNSNYRLDVGKQPNDGYNNIAYNDTDIGMETVTTTTTVDDLLTMEIVESHSATIDLLNLTGRLRRNLDEQNQQQQQQQMMVVRSPTPPLSKQHNYQY